MNGVITPALLNRGGPQLADALNAQSFVSHPWQRVLYVQSAHPRATDLNNAGTNPDAPLRTLQQANTVAIAGDVIVVGPQHGETVSAAGGTTISKNNLTIIGCGNGDLRPAIVVSAVAGYLEITGTGVRMINFQLVPTIDGVTKMVQVTGAHCVLDDFLVNESASFQSVTAIAVGALASGGAIRRLIAEQFTAGASQCILIAGALTEFSILDCKIRGNYSVGNISVTAAALHLDIGRNNLVNLNTNICIVCGAVAASGMIYNNYCVLTGATAAPFAAAITLGSAVWVLFQNYAVDAAALTGALIGTAAT